MLIKVYDVSVIVQADVLHEEPRDPIGYAHQELQRFAQQAALIIEAERCSIDGITSIITDIVLDFGKSGGNTSYAPCGVIYLLIPDKIAA